MGLAEVTFIVFLILKLIHVVDWSWWWVTAPLWISAAFSLLLIIGGGTAAKRMSK